MKRKTIRLYQRVSALAGAVFAGLLSGAVSAEITVPPDRCATLVGWAVESGTVTAAEHVSQGQTLISPVGGLFGDNGTITVSADFCRVSLQLQPTSSSNIKVDIWLPDTWNEKLFGYGGGGHSGGLGQAEATMNEGVGRGYAAATSDLGHTASASFLWAYNQPEKVVDFGHRANHLVAATAKQLIHGYYGIPATRAYFQGCSGGGREALMEVSRYPQDYDGVIAGAPAMSWGQLMTQQIWLGQISFWTPALLAKLDAVHNAVLQKCDALDGVADGVLENPLQCDFDPAEIQCGFLPTNSCLTGAEVNTLRKIYEGTKLSNGELIIPGLAKGSEGLSWLVAALVNMAGGPEYYKWMVYNDPFWNALIFDLDRDYAASRTHVQPIINSDNPDISEFTQRGGKLILYHGWNDTVIPAANSVSYFEAVSDVLGPSTQNNVRLFMVPGEEHCPGGFDMVEHLEAWVEQGQAPERVVAADGASSKALCPWPKTAHYNGSGSTTDAVNFTCME